MLNDYYQEIKKIIDERSKTIKTGTNVIHLSYLDGIISSDELREIENILTQSELELSSFDNSGLPQNTLEEYINVISISINSTLITNIMTGILSCIVWDSIKYAVKMVWCKVRNKEYTKSTAYHQETKKVTFGLEIKLDNNTSFNFRLDGDLSEELIETSLDKALEFLKTQKSNSYPKYSYFMTYNSTNEYWNKIDIIEELNKEQTKKNKNK